MLQRTISRLTQNPWHQGFLGTGHSAKAVLGGVSYTASDPFIAFMDDRLHLPGGEPVGGAHPHAGFETLTLVLKGNDNGWETGSFELMTAGKGIVHTEEITSEQDVHILQVWLALPPEKRWIQPSWQKILLKDVPTLKNDGYEIRVYSGSSNGLTSPVKNYTPLTLVEVRTSNNQTIVQELPASYHGLIYMLTGAVTVGDKTIKEGQAGWLNQSEEMGDSTLSIQSSAGQTHFVLYAAQPHKVSIVSHGPFVGDTSEDIARLYKEYRNGEMPHVNNLPAGQKYYHIAN